MQYNLFDEPLVSTDRVFRYPGSKITAAKHLAKIVPGNVKELVSPFIGGAGLERYLTGRGIRIYGSDLYQPLVTMWDYILNNNKRLAQKASEILHRTTREELQEYQKTLYFEIEDELEKVAYYWLFQNMCWNGITFESIFKYVLRDGEAWIANSPETQLTFIGRLREFYNPLITVTCCDYKEQLAKYPEMFSYLDPPYPDIPNFYGDSTKYTTDFNHEELRDILNKRNSLWILSYNDKELIRDLYADDKFIIRSQWWGQSTSTRKVSTDLVIYPKELEDVIHGRS